jgi:hypothetical protein
LYYKNFFNSVNKLTSALIAFHVYATIIYFCSFDFNIIASRAFDLLSFNSVVILLSIAILKFSNYSKVAYFLFLTVYSGLIFHALSRNELGYENILWKFFTS